MFFWHFFEKIEKELSYERWIDKYRLFQRATLEREEIVPWNEEEEWTTFRRFCKILYLQDHRDEARFDALLDWAIEVEKKRWLDAVQTALAQEEKEKTTELPVTPADPGTAPTPLPKPGTDAHKPKTDHKTTTKEPAADKIMYFHPQLGEPEPEDATNATGFKDIYLHTDEYFPVTRRQMGVAWQYLRRKEKGRPIAAIDIPATVRQVGQQGLFLEPVLQFAVENRSDNLIFFADCLGTMTPFNEFTRRLIATARAEGGHRRAPVWYFQNYPAGFVYRHENLSNPVKLSTALQKTNKNATLAIIISDAGAAQPDKISADYTEKTRRFIQSLYERVAHIIWLNPMPEHRWAGTPAADLQRDVTIMAPVFDEETINFPNTIRLLLKGR